MSPGNPTPTPSPTPTPVPGALSISPALGTTAPGGSTSFAVAASGPVLWRVNGVAGGSSTLGVVSATGQYTAPSRIPDGDSVVVTARLVSDTTIAASATMFFLPDATTRDYYVRLPRIVDVTAGTGSRIIIVGPATTSSINFLPSGGTTTPLMSLGNGVFTMTVSPSVVTSAYVPGSLHQIIGQLDYRTAANAQIKLTSLAVNVRDASIPAVSVTSLATDAQRSAYVLNLRVDTANVGPYQSATKRALELLGGDRFDFVAMIATVSSNNNRYYQGVRNEISGIGLTKFDQSAAWGGSGRLRGVIAFPLDDLFDGADRGFVHEHGHAWISFGTDPLLTTGSPHWPLSTMAHGVMGFSIGGSGGAGGTFPWLLTPQGDGTVRVTSEAASGNFTPLDLYLMGLLPPDSVPLNYILPASTSTNSLANGQILPATAYSISNYIATMGQRSPTSANSQRAFSTAIVVLSYGRLLTPAEMAFFDYASARAETRLPLRVVSGFATTTEPGFYLATGGRATLRTLLSP